MGRRINRSNQTVEVITQLDIVAVFFKNNGFITTITGTSGYKRIAISKSQRFTSSWTETYSAIIEPVGNHSISSFGTVYSITDPTCFDRLLEVHKSRFHAHMIHAPINMRAKNANNTPRPS